MTTSSTAGTLIAGGPAEALLTDLRRRVPGHWTGSGRGLLTEIRDGLADASEAYRESGLTAADAERRAVADFGDADQVAALCRRQVGTSSGFRSALVVAIAFPAMLACWRIFFLFFQHPRTLHPVWEPLSDVAAVDTVVGMFSDPQTSGIAVGNAFTAIGAAATGVALLTLGLLRARARRDPDRARPVAWSFAGATLTAVLLTLLLSAVTAGRPERGPSELLAEQVVQAISMLIIVLISLAAASTLRLNLVRVPAD